jgi:hypothetical protein
VVSCHLRLSCNNGLIRVPWRLLRRNELCPVHRLVSGCGREPMQKERTIIIRIGVQRIEDPHDPGYREHRSPAAMGKLLNRKIVGQDRKCAFCHEEFTDCNDIVPDSRDIGRKQASSAFTQLARKIWNDAPLLAVDVGEENAGA